MTIDNEGVLDGKLLLKFSSKVLHLLDFLPPSGVEASDAEEAVLNTLNNGQQLTVGSQFGEWAMLALARGDKDLSRHAEGYLEAVEQAINDGTLTLATDYARVTLALNALGIDPTTWNGLNAVEALLHFYLPEDGQFAHTLGGAANQMATEQSAYALVAYSRYAAEKNSLYDMADADTTGALQQVTSVRFALLFDGMSVTTDMETANTAEEAAKLVEETLNELGYSGNAYTVVIEEESFTAAVAGTAQNKSGENGSFTATVTVTNGTVTVTNGTVSARGLSVSGTITATAYVAPTLPSQPSAPVVKPENTTKNPFGDVTKNDWYYNAVLYVYENGLMNGTGNGLFAPNANTTRGMIVTILARQEGVDTAKSEVWYEAGHQWVMENGISTAPTWTARLPGSSWRR